MISIVEARIAYNRANVLAAIVHSARTMSTFNFYNRNASLQAKLYGYDDYDVHSDTDDGELEDLDSASDCGIHIDYADAASSTKRVVHRCVDVFRL